MAYPNPEQGRVANPVLNKGTGGFALDYGANAQAQRETGIDVSAFVQQAGAAGSVGRALENTGDNLAKIADSMIQSVNRRAVDNADIYIAEGNREIGTMLAEEKDPRKWQQLADEIGNRWQESSLADKSLMPAAKEAITRKMLKWRIDLGTQVIRSAHDRAVQMEADGLEGARLTALGNKNWQQADQITQLQVERQLISPATAAKQRIMAKKMEEDDQEEAQRNQHYDEINADPDGWIERNPTRPADMSAGTYDSLRNKAERNSEGLRQDDAKRFADGMESSVLAGVPWGPSMADEWEKDNPRITPLIREKMKAAILQFNDKTTRQNIYQRADYYASIWTTEAMEFDPKKDGWARYWELQQKIAMLPAPIRGDVSQVLERRSPNRYGNGEGENEIPTAPKQIISYELNEMLKNGRFGGFDNGQGVYDADYPDANAPGDRKKGQPVLPEDKNTTRELHVRDKKAYAVALDRKAKLEEAVNKWLRTQKNPTAEDALKYLYEITDEQTAGGLVDFLDAKLRGQTGAPPRALYTQPPDEPEERKKKVKGVNTPYEEPDLPRNPGPSSNILLPPGKI